MGGTPRTDVPVGTWPCSDWDACGRKHEVLFPDNQRREMKAKRVLLLFVRYHVSGSAAVPVLEHPPATGTTFPGASSLPSNRGLSSGSSNEGEANPGWQTSVCCTSHCKEIVRAGLNGFKENVLGIGATNGFLIKTTAFILKPQTVSLNMFGLCLFMSEARGLKMESSSVLFCLGFSMRK